MSKEPKTPEILVIGEHDVGKTHFGIQLYARLEEKKGELKLSRPLENLSIFSSALESLAQGLSAGHTPKGSYKEERLFLNYREKEYAVLWPEYSGETIVDLRTERRYDSKWRERIQNSNGWLLLLRPGHLTNSHDIINRPQEDISVIGHKKNLNENSAEWSDQASYIELLQMFLYIYHSETEGKGNPPPLNILLSCIDELPELPKSPPEYLKKRMPLLYEFGISNWAENTFLITALSSTEVSLSESKPNAEYVKKGPDQFGYIIQQDGTRSKDLTLPLCDLLQLL